MLAAAQETGLIPELEAAMPTGTAPHRFAHARPQTQQQCALTLLFLPSVGLKRPWDLRRYTGDGLALLSGRSRAYGYHHIERFLAHWTIAGGAEQMTDALVTWTAHLWHEPMTTAYLDGHRKPVYTDVLIPRGLIGRTGKILGCRALVLLHDAQGHPRWVSTHRGDTHLTMETESLVAHYESLLLPHMVSTIIVDREGMAAEFIQRLARAGREVITLLRADQYTGVASFTQVGEFMPISYDDQGQVMQDIAPAQFALDDLTVQVALLRDWRVQTSITDSKLPPRPPGLRGPNGGPMWWEPGWQATPTPAVPTEPRLIALVTTGTTNDPQSLVTQYTQRWPLQENIIKDWLLPLGLDVNHGFRKTAVINSEIAKRRDALERRLVLLQQRAASAATRYDTATQMAERLRQQTRRRGIVLYGEINALPSVPQWEPQWAEYKAKVKEMKAEADAELHQLWQRYATVEQRASQEYDKQQRYCQQQCDVLRKLEDLTATERTMYELDSCKDQLMTVCKLMLANLGMWVRDQYFPASYAHATWHRLAPFFCLPGRIRWEKQTVTVTLRPFPDRQLQQDLRDLCDQVQATSPRLPDGRVLRFTVAATKRLILPGQIPKGA